MTRNLDAKDNGRGKFRNLKTKLSEITIFIHININQALSDQTQQKLKHFNNESRAAIKLIAIRGLTRKQVAL